MLCYILFIGGVRYVCITFNKTNKSFEIAKKIIEAKISNQIAILRRYKRNRYKNNIESSGEYVKNSVDINIDNILKYKKHISTCENIQQLMGYEGKGLNPYLGFIHEDREGHIALVSDLIEEWRAILIDSMVMSLINGNEVSLADFEEIESEGACYLSYSGCKKAIEKYNMKMETTTSYLYGYSSVSYRRALEYQVRSLIHAMEEDNAELYVPLLIR